jgi:hypothetical protein
MKSPVGTTEKVYQDMAPNSDGGSGILDPRWSDIGVLWDRFGVASSRPCGTFRFSNLYPGLRPGLSSAVPAGLILQPVGSHAERLALPVKAPCCHHPPKLHPSLPNRLFPAPGLRHQDEAHRELHGLGLALVLDHSPRLPLPCRRFLSLPHPRRAIL